MKQVVDVNLFKGKIYITPYSASARKLWMAMPPVMEAHLEDPLHLGEAMLKALNKSEHGVSEESSACNVHPLQAHLKIKSWTALAKTSKCLFVTLENGTAEIIPTEYDYSSKALLHIVENKVSVDAVPKTLGDALVAMFGTMS